MRRKKSARTGTTSPAHNGRRSLPEGPALASWFSNELSGHPNDRPPVSALVVFPALPDLVFAVSALSMGGFQLTSATSFEQAKALLTIRPPHVLVAAVQLGEYNGLHLALRGKSDRAGMAAIVASASDDPVIRAEADALGATFIITPTSREELFAAVQRTLHRPADSHEPIRPPFDRRGLDRRVTTAVALTGPDRREHSDRRRTVHPSAVTMHVG